MEEHKAPKIRKYSWLGTPQCAEAWQKLAPLTGVDKDTLGKFQCFVFGPELTGFKEEEFSKETHRAFVEIARTVGEKSNDYRNIKKEIERGLAHGWVAVRTGTSLDREFGLTREEQEAQVVARKEILQIPRAKLLQDCLWGVGWPPALHTAKSKHFIQGRTEEEYLSEAHKVFVKALQSYSPQKGTLFSSYFITGLEFESRKYKKNKHRRADYILESEMRSFPREEEGSFLDYIPAKEEDVRPEHLVDPQQTLERVLVVARERYPEKYIHFQVAQERAAGKTNQQIADEMREAGVQNVGMARVQQQGAEGLKLLKEIAALLQGRDEGTAP